MKLSYQNAEIFISTGGRDFDGNGDVLLFIHGSGQSHLTFLQQGRFFANREWQVLTPDMPAHGHSGGIALSNIEAMADWYAGLMDALGVGSATLIGHSQGCLIGLEMAKRHPAKVTKLCLIAGAMAIPVNEALLDMADNKPELAYQAMVNWAHGNDSHLYHNNWPGQTHIEFGNQVMSGNDDKALFADLSACNDYQGGPEAAAAVTCQTIAILAAQDKMTPAKSGKKMAETIADCTMHIIPDSGHFLPSERPLEVNRILRNFIS